MKNLIFCFLLISGLACEPSERAHPDFSRLSIPQEIDHTLDLKKPGDPVGPSFFNTDNLELISTLEKDTSSSFKLDLFDINGVDMDPKGNIYITKGRMNAIFVYDKNGNIKYKVGREGKGPGEFLRIRAFDFSESFDTLYVLDENKIEIFLLSDNIYQPASTIYHEAFMAEDLCVLNNDIYLSGFKYQELDSLADKNKPFSSIQLSAGPILKYSTKIDEVVTSFGPVYHSYSGWWYSDAKLSATKLACNKRTNTVVGLLNNFAHFFGYDSDGKLKWISKITNFNIVKSLK